MKSVSAILLTALILLSAATAFAAPLKAAVLTGGHPFTEKPFLALFEGHEGVEFTQVPLKDDSEIFEDVSAWPYDVIVLYNMTQKISEKRQQNLLSLLDRGIGVVALHHAIAAYSDWPEFRKVIGVRYFLKDVIENGVAYPASQYDHDIDIPIHIAGPENPVTQGLKDFTVHDEVYRGYLLEPDNHYILTTDHPKSQKEIGWTRTYRNAKICYIQMGHGDSIFADPNYHRLLSQAIRWTAQK